MEDSVTEQNDLFKYIQTSLAQACHYLRLVTFFAVLPSRLFIFFAIGSVNVTPPPV